MKKNTFLFLALFLGLFVFVSPVFAVSIQTGTDVNSYNQIITDNYYAAGATVLLDNQFDKDVVVLGSEVTLRGQVAGDVLIVGGVSHIEGNIQGDLRVIGGEVYLRGNVEGDLVILGGFVELGQNSSVLGDSIVAGGQFVQNVALNNNLKLIAGKVILDNTLSGNAEITTQKITFGENAKIDGNLKYYAPQRAEEMSGSEISGNIVFNEIKSISETGVVKTTILNLLSFWILLKFITTLIVAFGLIYIFRVFTQATNDIAIKSFVKSFFLGILAIFLIPILLIVLFVSLVGMPLSILLFMLYVLVLILAPAIAGIVVGTLVRHLFKQENPEKVTFQGATIGVVLLTVLQFVPSIGDLTSFVFVLISVGAIYRQIFRSIFRKEIIPKSN